MSIKTKFELAKARMVDMVDESNCKMWDEFTKKDKWIGDVCNYIFFSKDKYFHVSISKYGVIGTFGKDLDTIDDNCFAYGNDLETTMDTVEKFIKGE